MGNLDDGLVDVTDLFVRLCLEAGVPYHGEQMLIPRDKWERWQYGLLREYLAEAEDDDSQDNQEN